MQESSWTAEADMEGECRVANVVQRVGNTGTPDLLRASSNPHTLVWIGLDVTTSQRWNNHTRTWKARLLVRNRDFCRIVRQLCPDLRRPRSLPSEGYADASEGTALGR